MKWWFLFFCGLALGGTEFLIVTADKTDMDKVTNFQAQRIYLGKLDVIDGARVSFITLREKDPLRQRFERALFGTSFDLADYWLSQRLLNEAKPPLEVGSWPLMLAYVERNPGLIGYVDKKYEADLKKFKLKVIAVVISDS